MPHRQARVNFPAQVLREVASNRIQSGRRLRRDCQQLPWPRRTRRTNGGRLFEDRACALVPPIPSEVAPARRGWPLPPIPLKLGLPMFPAPPRAHISRRWHPCRTLGASHMRGCVAAWTAFAIVDLGHPSDTSTPQSRVLVAVAPTVHSSLNQPSLSTQARVQLCKSPSNSIAFGLVYQSIPPVLVFAAASSGVDTVLGLELWAQSINIDRFHIASDGVFHLNAVARILKRDPLHTIVILSHNKWCSCRNWTWSRVRVDSRVLTWNIVLIHLRRSILRMLLLRCAKEELDARSEERAAPSLFLGYPSYPAERVDLDAVASGVDPARVT